MKKTIALIFSFYVCATAWAVPLNQTLPKVTIEQKGELELKGDDDAIIYTPWRSESLTGKVRVVQYMAGRQSAKAINEPFMDALKAASFPRDAYQTTTLINLNDTLPGTGYFVEKEAKKNKRKFYWSSIVLDETGAGQKTWKLAKQSSAIMVLNSKGHVLFFKEGPLSPIEINSTLTLIRSQLKK